MIIIEHEEEKVNTLLEVKIPLILKPFKKSKKREKGVKRKRELTPTKIDQYCSIFFFGENKIYNDDLPRDRRTNHIRFLY